MQNNKEMYNKVGGTLIALAGIEAAIGVVDGDMIPMIIAAILATTGGAVLRSNRARTPVK